MNFNKFSQFLDKLDSTSKRLEMTDILAEMIKELSPSEIKNGIYLSLGTLKAPFADLKFNFADKQMVKTLAMFSGEEVEKINQIYSRMSENHNQEKVKDPAATQRIKKSLYE